MSRLSCSCWVQLVVAGLPTAPVHSLQELDRQLGRVRGLFVGSREVSPAFLRVHGVTYSRSVVVPVAFQVRWMSVRPELEGAVSPVGGRAGLAVASTRRDVFRSLSV